MNDEVLAALAALEWFRNLPEDCRKTLIRWCVPARFSPGQWIRAEGDIRHGDALLIEGAVGAYAPVNPFRDTLVSIVGPGTLLATALVSRQAYATTIARAPTTLLILSDRKFGRGDPDTSEIQKRLAQLHSRQFGLLLERCAQRVALKTPARIAAELIFLENQFNRRTIMVTQEELSEMTGVSRKTVNHCVRQMEAQGVLQARYGGVDIRDTAALHAMVAAGAEPRAR